MIIPLAKPNRSTNGNDQTLGQSWTKVTATEAEGILIQIGLKVSRRQSVIGTQNKSLGITDDDVQPMEETGIGIVWPVLMGIAFQRRDVAAVSIAVDHAAISKSSVGKFLHRCLLAIGGYLHFQKARLPNSFRDNATKTSAFSVPRPRFSLQLGRQSMHHQIQLRH